jgi:hypothetical protein
MERQRMAHMDLTRCWSRAFCVVGLIGLLSISPAWGATAQQVEDAINKAKAYLDGLEKNGSWEASLPEGKGYQKDFEKGGLTALVTYALLAAGENPSDPRIHRAVAYLLKNTTEGTYAVSMRCQVWLSLGYPLKPEIKRAMVRPWRFEDARGGQSVLWLHAQRSGF